MVISDGDGGDGGEGEKGVFIESTETSLSERGRALRQLTQLKHLTVSVLPLYSHCQGILLLNSLFPHLQFTLLPPPHRPLSINLAFIKALHIQPFSVSHSTSTSLLCVSQSLSTHLLHHSSLKVNQTKSQMRLLLWTCVPWGTIAIAKEIVTVV